MYVCYVVTDVARLAVPKGFVPRLYLYVGFCHNAITAYIQPAYLHLTYLCNYMFASLPTCREASRYVSLP